MKWMIIDYIRVLLRPLSEKFNGDDPSKRDAPGTDYHKL